MQLHPIHDLGQGPRKRRVGEACPCPRVPVHVPVRGPGPRGIAGIRDQEVGRTIAGHLHDLVAVGLAVTAAPVVRQLLMQLLARDDLGQIPGDGRIGEGAGVRGRLSCLPLSCLSLCALSLCALSLCALSLCALSFSALSLCALPFCALSRFRVLGALGLFAPHFIIGAVPPPWICAAGESRRDQQ